ncbi:YdcF family protein [candidate division KSB1 bacterium]|nr:YdcF family protein [candidate division KSB1 bacterium]
MKPDHCNGLIILLGSPNSPAGKLYSIARERCERAIHLGKKYPDYKFLLTGGFGDHFNTSNRPHAFYLMQFLQAYGIPRNRFVDFAESRNTLEDASLSKPIVLKYQSMKIIVVTSDYHFDRAKFVFECEYADTDVMIQFSVTQTNEAMCEIDLAQIKAHEINALKNLKQETNQVTI